MAESKMPARIWAGQGKSCFRFWQKRKPHAFDNSVCNTLYHRADLVEPLVEALEQCQSALAMVIAPEAIKSTSVLHAFAQATEAERKARAAILRARQTEATP